MNIHEHQAKEVLKKYGANVPNGYFALNVKDLVEKAKNLNTEKEGIVILRTLVDGFMVPDKDQRLYLYNILGLSLIHI